MFVIDGKSYVQNRCTQTAQLSRGGCSPQVHKIGYIAVKRGYILVNISLLKIFIAIIVTYKSSCASD